MELQTDERDTLQGLSEGLSWDEIAIRLTTTPAKVKNNARRAYSKLGYYQLKAVCRAIQLGLIAGPEIPALGLSHLTQRQWQICLAVNEGLTNGEIAKKLHITTLTAKTHVQNILARLDLRNRCHLAAVVEAVKAL